MLQDKLKVLQNSKAYLVLHSNQRDSFVRTQEGNAFVYLPKDMEALSEVFVELILSRMVNKINTEIEELCNG